MDFVNEDTSFLMFASHLADTRFILGVWPKFVGQALDALYAMSCFTLIGGVAGDFEVQTTRLTTNCGLVHLCVFQGSQFYLL